MQSCPSSTCALWPTTTPSDSMAPPSRYCLMPTGPPTLALTWKSGNGSAAHRSDPPGQDLGSRAGTCWTCRAQGSQRPALQRTATRRDRRQLQWPSLPHPADAPASQKDRRPVSEDRKALAHKYRALNPVRLKAQLDDALETLLTTADRQRDHHPSVTVSSDATYAPR